MKKLIVVLALLWSWQASAHAANLLQNGTFDTSGGMNPVTVSPGPAGNSAAKSWTVFLNTPGSSITTELVPSNLVPGGTRIRVTTNGERNGLVQVFGAFGTGPKKVFACAWVYIVKGAVGLGTGNGGNTGFDMVLWKKESWERIEVSNGVAPANEIILYSFTPGDTEFYVESAEVNESSGPTGCKPK
jgi:hypothetical protein